MSFDPATMMAVSAGVSAIGSMFSGEGRAQAHEYNAQIAMQNALIARQQGEAAAEAQGRDAKRKLGSMVANFGASGVMTDSGSALEVLADSARMAMLDNLTIKYNANLKALSASMQGDMERSAGKNSRTAALLGAGAGAITGAGYYKAKAIPGIGTLD